MTALGEFLRVSARRRRQPGVWDCAAFPCAWAIECGFPDPMREWRGAYDTEDGARALIADAGGLDAMFARGFGAAGIPRAHGAFEPGDVAVVQLLGEEAGAVFTGERWALVSDSGLSFATMPPRFILAAWRVTHG